MFSTDSEFRITEFTTSQGDLILSRKKTGVLFSIKSNRLYCDYLGIEFAYDRIKDNPRIVATEELAFLWEVYVVGPYAGSTRRAEEVRSKMIKGFAPITPDELSTTIEDMAKEDKDALLKSLEVYMKDIESIQDKLDSLMNNWKKVANIVSER